jgi:hypothetical protein
VNAPASWPNSSLSISSAGTAAQLSFSIGCLARREPSWMARATSSLPVPRSPVTSTGAGAGREAYALAQLAHRPGCRRAARRDDRGRFSSFLHPALSRETSSTF